MPQTWHKDLGQQAGARLRLCHLGWCLEHIIHPSLVDVLGPPPLAAPPGATQESGSSKKGHVLQKGQDAGSTLEIFPFTHVG